MKIIIAILLFSFFSSFGHASKARLESLGQFIDFATGGDVWTFVLTSQYIEDDRNVFLNPALINTIEQKAIVEWGDAASAQETNTSPRAEGGFYKKGKFSYGFYLGNEDNNITSIRNYVSGDVLVPDDQIDFFIGGEGSKLKWGISTAYSSTGVETGIDQTQSLLVLKAGALLNNNISPFVHVYLKDEAKGTITNTDDDYLGETSYVIGASSTRGEMKYFGYYGNITGDFTLSGSSNTNFTNNRFTFGAARIQNLTPKKMFFYSLAYESITLEQSGFTDEKDAVTRAPIKIGFEYKAKDWLVLRGAISQNIIFTQIVTDNGVTKNTDTIRNNTTSSAGMSVIIDDLTFDGSFITTTGTISANNIMSRVSMNYKF